MKMKCPGCGRRVRVGGIKCPCCGDVSEFLFKCRRCGDSVGPPDDAFLAAEVSKALGVKVDVDFVPGLDVETSPDWKRVSEGVYQHRVQKNKYAFKGLGK